MKLFVPIFICILLTIGVFHRFFIYGEIPMPGNFMVSWYEPWKTVNTVNGVPTIQHKPIGDDIFRQIYPQKYLAIQQIKQGLLPLWNPYNGSGQPLLATLHSGFLNPFSLLLFFGVEGWAWYIILQFPLLFLATYGYSRLIQLSKISSLISSSVLCLSGVVITRIIYGDYIYALVALPLLLTAIELFIHKRILLFAVLLPISIWFLFVSVQPQISLYIYCTVLLYAIVRLLKLRITIFNKHISGVWGFLVFSCIGFGLLGIQLIPTLELYSYANVTKASSSFIFEKFLVPFSHLISIGIPNFFGNPGTYNFWGYTDYVETVGSVGTVSLLVSLVSGLLFVKKRIVAFFTTTAIVTVLLTIKSPITALLYNIPLPVISTSIPTRIYILTTFSIAILVGYGIDYMMHTCNKVRFRNTIIGWSIIVLFFFCHISFFIFNISCINQVNCTNVAMRNSLLEGIFVGGFLSFSIVTYIFFTNRIKYVAFCLLGIVICSGFYNSNKFIPFSRKEYIMPSHSVMSQLKSFSPVRIRGEREAQISTDFATYYEWFDSNYYDPLYIKRYGELFSYAHTEDKNLGLSRSDILMDSYVEDQKVADKLHRLSQLVGIGYLVTKSIKNNDQVVWNQDNWNIITYQNYLPRAYVSSNVVSKNEQEILPYLFSNDFDPQKTVVIEEDISFINNDDGIVSLNFSEYTSQKVKINISTENEKMLVLTDTYYPGWKAYVNGEETKIYRTNYAFRGILVPSGFSTVEFVYSPLSLHIGIFLSVFILVVWLLLIRGIKTKIIKL